MIELENTDFLLGIMHPNQINHLKWAKNSPNFIICAHATHGTNKYGLKFVIILVIDSFGMGVPVCFFYTSKENEIALAILFTKIKAIVGDLQPKVFNLLQFILFDFY
jgi:uncharacterized radical SAM superfamily Fe-S cluster-containing enzyme